MKAFVITIEGNDLSEQGSQVCIESSWAKENEFSIERFDATTPDDVEESLKSLSIEWDYPWRGEVIDFGTGLTKKAYPTNNHLARIACAVSHYRLWLEAVETEEDVFVLEHDAVFTEKLDPESVLSNPYFGIVGVNDPRGVTRKSSEYHSKVQLDKGVDIVRVPRIDSSRVPQGLAGNSAYIIKPWAAEHLLTLVEMHGLWPNDALMCYQLFPELGQTTKYYTKTQRLRSTTTL